MDGSRALPFHLAAGPVASRLSPPREERRSAKRRGWPRGEKCLRDGSGVPLSAIKHDAAEMQSALIPNARPRELQKEARPARAAARVGWPGRQGAATIARALFSGARRGGEALPPEKAAVAAGGEGGAGGTNPRPLRSAPVVATSSGKDSSSHVRERSASLGPGGLLLLSTCRPGGRYRWARAGLGPGRPLATRGQRKRRKPDPGGQFTLKTRR